MQAGMTITNEPGYYHDGRFGIRIENVMLTVPVDTKNNHQNQRFLGLEPLTLVPIQKKMIEVGLLSSEEREWLNIYHKLCLNKVGPFLKSQPAALQWLTQATKPL
eukprot:g51920.t1